MVLCQFCMLDFARPGACGVCVGIITTAIACRRQTDRDKTRLDQRDRSLFLRSLHATGITHDYFLIPWTMATRLNLAHCHHGEYVMHALLLACAASSLHTHSHVFTVLRLSVRPRILTSISDDKDKETWTVSSI